MTCLHSAVNCTMQVDRGKRQPCVRLCLLVKLIVQLGAWHLPTLEAEAVSAPSLLKLISVSDINTRGLLDKDQRGTIVVPFVYHTTEPLLTAPPQEVLNDWHRLAVLVDTGERQPRARR